MVQTTDRPLKIVDKDMTDSFSTTLTMEREGNVITLSMFPTNSPDFPGESMVLSLSNAAKLHNYLGKLLYGR